MSGFRWTTDNSRQVKAAYRAALAAGLSDGTEFLLEESNRTVPIEEATLTRSGTATVDVVNLIGVVAYDGPYAVKQHEDLTLRHDPGRRAKWLELTMSERAGQIGRVIQAGAKAAL